MASFPSLITPKSIKRETQNEVDNSPAIYNARDYNIHLRELIAIEKTLVGKGMSVGTDSSLLGVLIKAINAYDSMANDGLISISSGTVQAGNPVLLPSGTLIAYTSGQVGPTDTTINVGLSGVQQTDFTAGFPTSGVLTKFNSTYDFFTSGGGGGITSQEIIVYTGISPTSFLNCTRGVVGTTSQIVSSNESALIVGGRASIMLGLNSWLDNTNPLGPLVSSGILTIAHDAILNTYAFLGNPAQQAPLPAGTSYAIGVSLNYSLAITKTFENIDSSDILG